MKKCILVFDDEQEILFVTKIILEKNGYRVEIKNSCHNLIEDICEIKPDVILMDLWIPPISGENAVRAIRANEETGHIPIIFFSANTDIEAIASRSKAQGFLKKPFEIATLLEVIESNMPTPR